MTIMSNTDLINSIKNALPIEQIRYDEPMSAHTSFRIGGNADIFVTVCNEAELSAVLGIVTEFGARHMLIGNGSDLLFSDQGYRGIIIKLGGEFESIELLEAANKPENEFVGTHRDIRVGAARMLSGMANFARDHGLSGLEFASGIPGTVGGALFMNAGAYGGEIGDVVQSVTIMKSDGSAVYELSGDEVGFSYRHSILQESGDIALYAVLRLEIRDKAEISNKMNELAEKRKAKQPVNYPSAGSTFKRPAGGFAAALIEEAGLKGRTVGGAQVSEKHSGFIINTGGATAGDVRSLIDIVRNEVLDASGIELEPEIRIIDEEADAAGYTLG